MAIMPLLGCINMVQALHPQSQVLSVLHAAFGPHENWKTNPLKGGLSGASLFLADNGKKKYVVRFFSHLSKDQTVRLISANKAASSGGYGPHVYFDDAVDGVIVTDYLTPQPLNSGTLHQDLALLLKKIHRGPQLQNAGHLWERTMSILHELKKVNQSLVDIPAIENDLNQLVKKASQNLESAPCHRDLNPTNLIYTHHKLFAVDYDSAGQDDPYIDVAEVAIFYCSDEKQEIKFITSYLDHPPSQAEIDKFLLMKKIAFFFYGVEFLREVPQEIWEANPSLEPFQSYLNKLGQGTVSLEDPKEKLRMGLIMIQEALKP